MVEIPQYEDKKNEATKEYGIKSFQPISHINEGYSLLGHNTV